MSGNLERLVASRYAVVASRYTVVAGRQMFVAYDAASVCNTTCARVPPLIPHSTHIIMIISNSHMGRFTIEFIRPSACLTSPLIEAAIVSGTSATI